MYKLNNATEKVPTSLFDSISVLDQRDFKENLGIVQLGAFNARAQVVAEPSLEIQLKDQLTKAIEGSTKRGTLLLRLEKFYIAELTGMVSETGYFDFSAVLFAKDGEDSYWEVAAIDTSLTVGGMDVTKKILNQSSMIVNNFILGNLSPVQATSKRMYSFAEVDAYPEILKEKIPLYTVEKLQDGLYRDFKEFKELAPSGGEVALNAKKSDGNFYQKDVNGKLKKIAAKSCYAVVLDGQAYISCLGGFYPLNKEDADYFFTGPALQTASASAVVASSVLFGAVGAAIASGPNRVSYFQKLDFRNGSFIRIERRQ